MIIKELDYNISKIPYNLNLITSQESEKKFIDSDPVITLGIYVKEIMRDRVKTL